jgi:hypothetical protein
VKQSTQKSEKGHATQHVILPSFSNIMGATIVKESDAKSKASTADFTKGGAKQNLLKART